MGMYTGHRVALALRGDTPPEVIEPLQAALTDPAAERAWPIHPLFLPDARQAFFGAGQDAGFGFDEPLGGALVRDGEGWRLTLTGASKGNEERHLLWLGDYLKAHLAADEGQVLGVIAYEDNFHEFADEDDGEGVGFGYGSNTSWGPSHQALVWCQGEVQMERRRGDLTGVPLQPAHGWTAPDPELQALTEVLMERHRRRQP